MKFAVTPATIPHSADGASSLVDLSITMTNDSEEHALCEQLVIRLPVQQATEGLTVDPSTVTTAPGDATPWAVATNGDGVIRALILPPATGLEPGATAEFILGGIVVNDSPGTAAIQLSAVGGGSERQDEVRVHKDRPAEPGEGVPIVEEFEISPDVIAQGGTAVASWRVRDANTVLLSPGSVPLPEPAQGELPVTVWESTTYQLTAIGKGGVARKDALVLVKSVEIDEFSASPTEAVPAGDPATLKWSTRYATACSIDQGVGQVPTTGTIEVRPTKTTVYTLDATGLRQAVRSVIVNVLPTN